MGLLENIIKKVVLEAAVIEQKEKISASVYKIRLKSESLKKADFKQSHFAMSFGHLYRHLIFDVYLIDLMHH